MRMSEEAFWERYTKATHAMQTAVAVMIGHDPTVGSPKDLRVGLNSALVDSGALAELLIKKGVFTSKEYAQAVTEMMEREAHMRREELVRRGIVPDSVEGGLGR
jgi:hypothetical protein